MYTVAVAYNGGSASSKIINKYVSLVSVANLKLNAVSSADVPPPPPPTSPSDAVLDVVSAAVSASAIEQQQQQ